MDDSLQDQYEFEFETTFSALERVGDYEFDSGDYADDPYGDIYENAVYGGEVAPDKSQHFYIYRVDWPQEGEQKPTSEKIEQLGDRLDSVFAGWVVNKDGDRVFALSDATS